MKQRRVKARVIVVVENRRRRPPCRVGPPRGDHREGRLHGSPHVAGDDGDAAAAGGEIGGGA